MAYRPSKRMRHHHYREELNLTPIMNIFMIIVPFLLLTAVFAKTVVIDVYLPQENQSELDPAIDNLPEILTIKVTENGFELSGIGDGVIIDGSQYNLNYKQLTKELARLKDRYPDKEEVILLFDPYISYDIVIKVMDAARETTEGGKRTLFPHVSLGEVEKSE